MKKLDIKEFNQESFNHQVKNSLAGYKSNYNRSINNARSANERKALIDARSKWIATAKKNATKNVAKRFLQQFLLVVNEWSDEYNEN